MKSGKLYIDITKYGDFDGENIITLSDEDFEKFVLCNGKDIKVKLRIEDIIREITFTSKSFEEEAYIDLYGQVYNEQNVNLYICHDPLNPDYKQIQVILTTLAVQ